MTRPNHGEGDALNMLDDTLIGFDTASNHVLTGQGLTRNEGYVIILRPGEEVQMHYADGQTQRILGVHPDTLVSTVRRADGGAQTYLTALVEFHACAVP